MTPAESLARARALTQPAFISLVDDAAASPVTAGPLAGRTFAIKDNIDLAGVPTTAADPRVDAPAPASAPAVQRLLDAGAVAIGKTNLDQYATGLVGTRSPYGACHAVASPDHVSGGSSSGSAVAVAAGVVDFALGTDTAGSGRVPAAFNGVVGVKPSRGLVPTRGTVPACASLDCVTVLAGSVRLAREVLAVMAGPDPEDPWSRTLAQAPAPQRPVLAVPDVLPGLDPVHEKAWLAALERADDLGETVVVDVAPLLAAAELLYAGPWVAERTLAFGDRLTDDPAVDPTVRAIVGGAPSYDGPAVFAAFHRLAELARQAAPVWAAADALLLPVTCTHPTLAEVAADPVGVNTRLGRFTNMTNLLDLCAVAVPGPERDDGLPFGVQLLAPAGHDLALLDVAARWCGEEPAPAAPAAPTAGGPARGVRVAVAGAHLSGQPLNGDLVERGGRLLCTARTAPDYRMYVVDGPLPRPGLTRTGTGAGAGAASGPGLEVEVWELPPDGIGSLLQTVLPPLAVGPLELADGSTVLGFVCTADGVDPARDITAHGGWRAWLASGTGSG